MTLNDWRSRGAYTVSACGKRGVTIDTNKSEIRGALLCDVEYLLDHMTEHKLSIRASIMSNNWTSPSWLYTTLYYWSFFAAVCFTRLLGNTIWFLDKAASRIFAQIGPVAAEPPAGGAFALSLSDTGYLDTCQVELLLASGRLHDAVWVKMEALARDAFIRANPETNSEEHLVWRCIIDVISLLGVRWLSDLRNLVNYRPGEGYLDITRANVVESLVALRSGSPYTWPILVEELRQAVARMRTDMTVRSDVKFLSRTAVVFTIVFSTLVEDLHLDVLGRVDGDFRWLNERTALVNRQGALAGGNVWPLRA